MARYQYRTAEQLGADIATDTAFDDRGRAILRAALKVAEKAHAGQSREKIDPAIPYFCHPIMVYDIMRRMGEADPVVLAAALLHDALEDHSRYRANDIDMGDDLMQALFAEGIEEVLQDTDVTHAGLLDDEMLAGDAYRTTNQIMRLCREVTNPVVFSDGIKENYQVDRVKAMSLSAKKIKLADQAASILCNLTMANDPELFPNDNSKEHAFTEKAISLAITIIESVQHDDADRAALDPWHHFFGRVVRAVQPLLHSHYAVQRESMRERFDFDGVFVPDITANILPEATDVVKSSKLSAHPDNLPESGTKSIITDVHYDAAGRVVNYRVLTDLSQPVSAANQMQEKLTKAIRTMRRRASQYSSGLHRGILVPRDPSLMKDWIDDSRLQESRIFQLVPPVAAQYFASAASSVNAISWADHLAIIEAANAMLPPEPPAKAAEKPVFKPRWR